MSIPFAFLNSTGEPVYNDLTFVVNTVTAGSLGVGFDFTGINVPGVTVDWGDGNSSSTADGKAEHVYDENGEYIIQISGGDIASFNPRWAGNSSPLGIIKCLSFGQYSNLTYPSFIQCRNLTEVPATLPSSVTTLASTFRECRVFNQDISSWNVENITDMSNMFWNAFAFNQPIGSWDINAVTLIAGMFRGASDFNQGLNSWNINNGNITSLNNMFLGASSFNGNITSWSTGNITNMNNMFQNASSFNQNLSGWNVSSVTTHSDFDTGATAWESQNKPIFP